MPGLWCSPVCLTVICFFSWSLAPSRAQNGRDEVSGLQYGRLNSNVTLPCGKSPVRTPVVWHLNHSSVLPWHQVTSDGSLILLQTDHSAQGDYSCYDHQGLLLHSLSLRLGYPPGRLHISCRVPNHKLTRCSWYNSVDTYLPAQYNVSYRGKNAKKEYQPCVVDASGKYCEIDHPSYWETSHVLQVTETNPLGSNTSMILFNFFELLKPDPPEAVVVEALEGHPTRLQVCWNLPSSWPPEDQFPLYFHIRYKPPKSSYWSELFSLDCPLTIPDALAGHVHQVEVRARDEVNVFSQWSEWSAPVLAQPWEDNSTLEIPSATLAPDPEDFFPLDFFPPFTKPETSTAKSQSPEYEEEGNLGLVILLVLFSVVIFTTVLSLVFVMWVKQRRRNQANKQELTSMVKMKSMSI